MKRANYPWPKTPDLITASEYYELVRASDGRMGYNLRPDAADWEWWIDIGGEG